MKKLIFLALGAYTILLGCSKEDEVVPFEDQFAIDQAKIDQYLEANGIQASVEPNSEMRYVIHDVGTGSYASLSETVTVDFEGKLLNGEVFGVGEFNTFNLSTLIAGWQIGLPLLREGGSMTIYVPSGYGFGTESSEFIPANSVLIFDVDLLEVAITPEERLTYEATFIDEYLAENEIVANVDSISQIRYVIHEEGTGERPIQTSDITINYEGRVLNSESNFDAGTDVTFNLNGLIEGWQLGVPLIKEGGSITLYLPSVYGYGGQAVGTIPANSILVFDIDLLEVN